MNKVFWKSKTIWVNVLTVLASAGAQLAPVVDQLALAGVDPKIVAVATAVVGTLGLANIWLRVISKTGVSLK